MFFPSCVRQVKPDQHPTLHEQCRRAGCWLSIQLFWATAVSGAHNSAVKWWLGFMLKHFGATGTFLRRVTKTQGLALPTGVVTLHHQGPIDLSHPLHSGHSPRPKHISTHFFHKFWCDHAVYWQRREQLSAGKGKSIPMRQQILQIGLKYYFGCRNGFQNFDETRCKAHTRTKTEHEFLGFYCDKSL